MQQNTVLSFRNSQEARRTLPPPPAKSSPRHKPHTAALPPALPDGWEMRLTASGRPFFANRHTRQTTWGDPRHSTALPAGWEQGLDRDGAPYYIDHAHRRTQRTRPSEACVVDMTSSPARQRSASLGSWESLTSLLSSVSARSVEAVQGKWRAARALIAGDSQHVAVAQPIASSPPHELLTLTSAFWSRVSSGVSTSTAAEYYV